MIDPGKMRHRITFQRFTGEADAYGDPLQAEDANWEDVAQQSQSAVSHKIRCRWHPGLETAMRIVCGKRTFRPLSVINWEERNESFLIMAEELVP